MERPSSYEQLFDGTCRMQCRLAAPAPRGPGQLAPRSFGSHQLRHVHANPEAVVDMRQRLDGSAVVRNRNVGVQKHTALWSSGQHTADRRIGEGL